MVHDERYEDIILQAILPSTRVHEPAATRGRIMGCSNDSVIVLGGSGTSGHYFDDAVFLGFRNRLKSTRCWVCLEKSQPPGGETEWLYAGSCAGSARHRRSKECGNQTLMSDCGWPRTYPVPSEASRALRCRSDI